MSMARQPPPKRKSQQRFEQLNFLVDVVAPSLTKPSQVAAILACYRHATPSGTFRVSTERLARSISVSHRQARRIMDELVDLDVLVVASEHSGPVPRQYRFTGRRASKPPDETGTPASANG